MHWIMIPAYNEEEDLPKLLTKLNKELTEKGWDYRLLVFDDGSTDKTPEIIEEHKEKMNLEMVRHLINRGLGETERDAFEYIAMRCEPDDIIIRVEADDTHEPKYIFSLIEKLCEGYDVVNTSRFQPGGGQMGVSGYRTLISRAANLFMKLVFRIPGTRDYSCGFRAYRARVIQDAIRIYGDKFIQLRGLGFTSTLEMIVKLHLMGCNFAEIPFVLRYDQKESNSKMVSSITSLGYLMMGVLYYWPFGGWLIQHRELSKMYKENPDKAIEKFQTQTLPRVDSNL